MKITDYVNSLPDSYQKTPDSNNYKLLLLEQLPVKSFRDDISAVHDTLDILKCTGKTLDLYGLMYNQPRGSMTDEQYRYIVLQKATRLMTGCDHTSIITALAVILGVPVESFSIVETDQSFVVEVKDLPFSVLQEAGITASQAFQMISSMLPSGVRLSDNTSFDGTFEFAELANEYDKEKGFGSVDQTIGGYFGMLTTDNIEIPD